MRQTEPKLILSEPPTVDYFAPVGSLYMNVLVKRTGDVCKPNRVVGVTPIEHVFEIESSAGCRMIVSLLVVTTNVAAPARQTKMARRHMTTSTSSSSKSTSGRHHSTVLLETLQCSPFCADPALVLLQIRENQIRCVHFMSCVYNIHK